MFLLYLNEIQQPSGEYSSAICGHIQKNDYLCNPKLSDTGEIERRLSFITLGFRLVKTYFDLISRK